MKRSKVMVDINIQARTIIDIFGSSPEAEALSAAFPTESSGMPALPYAHERWRLASLAKTPEMKEASGWHQAVALLEEGMRREGGDSALFDIEKQKIDTVLQQYLSPESVPESSASLGANLNTVPNQLLWYAALHHLNAAGVAVAETPLWQEMQDTAFVDGMRMLFATRLSAMLNNPYGYRLTNETTLEFGEPGSHFYFSPQENRINLDLLECLVVAGEFDASRYVLPATNAESVFYHEAKHAESTLFYPELMEKIWVRQAELMIQAGQGDGLQEMHLHYVRFDPASVAVTYSLTVDEAAELAALQANWRTLAGMHNAVEDHMCNQGLVHMTDPEKGGNHPYNLPDGINVMRAIVTGEGEMVISHAHQERQDHWPEDTPSARLEHLSHVANMCWYMANHMMPDTPESWAALGVKTQWLLDHGHPEKEPEQVLEEMRALLQQVSNAQPAPIDRNLKRVMIDPDYRVEGKPEKYDRFEQAAEHYCEVRNSLIETFIERYASGYLREQAREAEQEMREQLQDRESSADKPSEDREKQKNADQTQEQQGAGEKSAGQEGKGGGAGQQGAGEKSAGQEGKGGGEGQQGAGEKSAGQEGKGSGEGRQGAGEKGNGQEDKGGGEGQQSAAQESRSGKGGSGGKSGQGQGKGKTTVSVEGNREIQVDSLPESNPRKAQDKAADQASEARQGKEGDAASKAQPQPTIGEEAGRYANGENPGKNSQKPPPPTRRIDPDALRNMRPAASAATRAPSAGAGVGEGLLGDLPLGSGDGFRSLQKHQGFRQAASLIAMEMVRASESSAHQIPRRETSGSSFAPRGGFSSSLDSDKFQRLIESQRSGRRLASADDLRLYRDEENIPRAVMLTTLVGIDGSGSMGSGEGSYMAYCANALGLMAMASRETAMFSSTRQPVNQMYGFVWGDSEPRSVLSPDLDEQLEARAIDSVIRGINSGTELAPFVPAGAKRITEHMQETLAASLQAIGEEIPYGMLNVQIYSDGDTFECNKAQEKASLARMLENAFVTLDIFITGGSTGALCGIAEELKAEYGDERVALHRMEQAEEIPVVMYRASQERFAQAARMVAEMPEERLDALRQIAEDTALGQISAKTR
jgi:hypothetical protein